MAFGSNKIHVCNSLVFDTFTLLSGTSIKSRCDCTVNHTAGAISVNTSGLPCETFIITIRDYSHANRTQAVSPIRANRHKPRGDAGCVEDTFHQPNQSASSDPGSLPTIQHQWHQKILQPTPTTPRRSEDPSSLHPRNQPYRLLRHEPTQVP